MLERFIPFGLFAFSMLALSCGAPGVKTAEPGERISLPAVAIEVPQDQGWVYSHRTEGQDHYLQLFRRSDSPTYTYLATVNVTRMPKEALQEGLPTETEFLRQVKEISQEQMPRSRFISIEESFRLDPRFSDLCVCTEASARDMGASNAGDEPFLILQAKSYNFVLERDEAQQPVFIHISYTERGKADEIGADFADRAEHFFAAIDLAK